MSFRAHATPTCKSGGWNLKRQAVFASKKYFTSELSYISHIKITILEAYICDQK